ncbi:MAG: tetratricopeptide repeat protein [Candidatus Sumerlaeaceae bacterium]
MLRLLVNKARHHYNDALEHAERGRTTEAIDELRNALDLDRRFSNAHVVLGTLYAKEGEYEKARECWKNAIELSSELSKAHHYLQRVQAVENTLPALKSYRWMALALVVLVIGLGSALGYMLRPDPTVRRLAAAKQLYQQQKYGKALKELESVRRSSDPGSATNIASDALRLALKTDMNQQIKNIQTLKFNNRYSEALAAITALEANVPDNETSSRLALLREDIAHYYLQDIKDLYLDFETGGTTYAHLKQEIEKFLDVTPDVPEKAYISDYLTSGAKVQAAREIGQLREEFAANHDYLDARARLSALMSTFPNSDELQGGRTDLIDEILSWMFETFHLLVEQRHFADAEQLLNDIDDSIDDFRDVVDVSGPADLARRVLSDKRRNAQIANIGELLHAGRFADAELALFYLSADDLSPEQAQLLAPYEKQLEEHYALQRQQGNRSRLERSLKLQMSNEEASATLAALDNRLRDSKSEQERLSALVEAAASAAKLGKKDLLTSLSARLKVEGADTALVDQVSKLGGPAVTPARARKSPAAAESGIRIEPAETESKRDTPTRQELPPPPSGRRISPGSR